jgi:peroxiredoxin
MSLTPSTMVSLGSSAPEFELQNTLDDKYYSLPSLKGEKATVVLFICNHCPYVVHIAKSLADLATKFQKLGVGFVAISSNDITAHPADSPENMRLFATKYGFTFPYLYDETQAVARGYEAACTPDLYVYDSDLKLKYRGQYDNSRPGNQQPPTGNDLASALEAIMAGEEPTKLQKPSIGCNIKWKNGGF